MFHIDANGLCNNTDPNDSASVPVITDRYPYVRRATKKEIRRAESALLQDRALRCRWLGVEDSDLGAEEVRSSGYESTHM